MTKEQFEIGISRIYTVLSWVWGLFVAAVLLIDNPINPENVDVRIYMNIAAWLSIGVIAPWVMKKTCIFIYRGFTEPAKEKGAEAP